MPQKSMGPVMIDLEGINLTPYEREKINHPNTGAVILFSRNYTSPEQMTKLINDIRMARHGDILIAVDQEGGRVQRFQSGLTRLPAVACFAQRPELTQSAGWLMAMELITLGIDFSFAPVLDVDTGISNIIGDRSFSSVYQTVCELASQFRQGMRSAGMAATGKHFPGHGAIAEDSHLTLPVDHRDLDSIQANDLQPFQQLIREGIEAIMPAHVVYPQVDSLPAGFSPRWIQQILRQQLQFNGVVFSDDLSMQGAASLGDYPQRAKLALQAGCDMVLVCNNPSAADQVLEVLPISPNPQRQQRLKTMQAHPSFTRSQLLSSPQWQSISQQVGALYE